MKKFLATVMVLVLSIAMLCACNNTPASTEKPSESASSTVPNKESASSTLPSSESATKPTVFQQFEAALTEKNLTFEKVTMAAELIGAEQGVKYKLQDENVEIYRFDTSSDAYLEAEKTQSLKMEGFGAFEATVVNGYAINSDNLELINIFKDIVSKQ